MNQEQPKDCEYSICRELKDLNFKPKTISEITTWVFQEVAETGLKNPGLFLTFDTDDIGGKCYKIGVVEKPTKENPQPKIFPQNTIQIYA
ncbi:hypothetical protein HZA39_01280 [Candidatus Peregrinibacteria bacterium]|nr:hypothetical protein [Candidatus Peregrinibacteria bacterium]